MNEDMMRSALELGLPALGRSLSEAQLQTLISFGSALIEKNQVMNLTAITQPDQVAQLHFLDCIALLGAADFHGKAVIDVGCGAGFPGVPLKIAQPDIQLTLLDSLKKRMDWLSEVLPALDVPAQVVCARAEEYCAEHREQYDIAVSRAVARLRILSELCLPLVRIGGQFIAMKSVDSDQELSEAAGAISTLGGKVLRIRDYPIPGTDTTHRAVVISKVRATPKSYPRRFSKIKQHPL